MVLPVTSVFAAIFSIFFVGLTFNVIFRRTKLKTSIGDKNDEALQRKIRAHGNFSEYTAFFLILFGLLEIQGILSKEWLVLLGLTFLTGRALHFYGISALQNKRIKFAVSGMVITTTSFIVMALLLLGNL